jgi:hypothetical protein
MPMTALSLLNVALALFVAPSLEFTDVASLTTLSENSAETWPARKRSRKTRSLPLLTHLSQPIALGALLGPRRSRVLRASGADNA